MKFCYREYAVGSTDSGQPIGEWKRCLDTDISSKIIDGRAFYITIQSYSSREKKDGELELTSLFFDLDAEDSDYDWDRRNMLFKPMEETQKLATFLLDIGVSETEFLVYFSGNRGFHVHVHPSVLGLDDNSRYKAPVLSLAQGEVANTIKTMLELETLDMSLYSTRHLLRYPGTYHNKSGLFKTFLPVRNFIQMDDPNQVLELAKDPEIGRYSPLDEPNEWLMEQLKTGVELVQAKDKAKVLTASKFIPDEIGGVHPGKDNAPDCVRDIAGYNFGQGDRNQATLILAGYMKAVGFEKAEALQWLKSWSEKMPTSVTKSKTRERIANTISVVDAVYRSELFGFHCKYMSALKVKPDCAKPNCPFVQDGGRYSEVVSVAIDKVLSAKNMGKTLEFNASIAAVGKSPYIVPSKVMFKCTSQEGCDKNCVLNSEKYADGVTFELLKSPKNALQLIDTVGGKIVKKLKQSAGVNDKCGSVSYTVLEYKNITDIHVETPKEENTKKQISEVECLYIGEELGVNTKYRLRGELTPNPRSQRAVVVIDNAEPQISSLDGFDLVESDVQRLYSLFSPKTRTLNAARDKWDEIHADIAAHVTGLYQREQIAKAIMSVYCSPLSFYFDGDYKERGYLECLIWGDTAQGKTAALGAIQKFLGLGDWIDGKTATRTGLAYSANQDRNNRWYIRWGILPKNDQGLVVIDELGGLGLGDSNVINQLTSIRSSGMVKVDGIRRGIARARVRVIYAGNNASNRNFDEFRYGITSVLPLFGNRHEDVRRLDFLAAVSRGDVQVEDRDRWKAEMRSQKERRQKYPAEDFQKLVLWAWSRSPGQITFTEDAVKQCYKAAKSVRRDFDSPIALTNGMVLPTKISRLSASIAAQLFSHKNDGKSLIVRKFHVELAEEFLRECYSHPSLNYREYSDHHIKNKASSAFEVGDMTLAAKELEDDIGTGAVLGAKLVLRDLATFLMDDLFSFSPFELREAVGKESEEIILPWLRRHKLLEGAKGGRRQLTPRGSRFFRWIVKTKRWNS